jgi:hypothetical protein
MQLAAGLDVIQRPSERRRVAATALVPQRPAEKHVPLLVQAGRQGCERRLDVGACRVAAASTEASKTVQLTEAAKHSPTHARSEWRGARWQAAVHCDCIQELRANLRRPRPHGRCAPSRAMRAGPGPLQARHQRQHVGRAAVPNYRQVDQHQHDAWNAAHASSTGMSITCGGRDLAIDARLRRQRRVARAQCRAQAPPARTRAGRLRRATRALRARELW